MNLPPVDEPAANTKARTETAERVMAEARRILAETGHSQERVDWAKSILGTAAMWGKT